MPATSSLAPLFERAIARSAAVKDAAPRLSYYASQLPDKETWFQTPECYRIYKNVPIARTGSQTYLGRELKKNPGYKPEWNLGDDELVDVYRPLAEVTHPAALASFEIKSILDEHPADPQILVDALDELDGVSKGAAANIRVGEIMADGETPIIADLHVKNPELNVKIDGGTRDVSCGYTFRLDKDADGRFIQTQIRGNHIAIVPKGRAGSEVGIKDAAPEMKIRRLTMSNRLFRALGFQAAIKDAKPGEVADAIDALKDEDKEEDEKEAAKDKAAKDEKAAEDKAKDKAAKDKKSAKDAEGDAHPKDCRCSAADCMADRATKDADADDDGMDDADKEDDEDDEVKDKKGAKDDDALILSPDEHAKSEFSVGDTAALLNKLKPAVARSKDKGVKDAFIQLTKNVRQVQSGVKDGAPDPFAALTRIAEEAGANDAEPEIPMFQFFNGKPYAEGVKAYNDYQTARNRK